MAKLLTFSPATSRPYDEAEADAVHKAVLSGHLSVVFGRETIRFENEFARLAGCRYAAATSSGTAALELSLQCLGIGLNDEVIVPGYTFAATATAVLRNMAVVRFADIDPNTWNMSLETIKPLVTEKTKAIIVVGMFGNPPEMAPIMEFARQRGLYVIEDAAQAAGSEIDGKPLGSFGDIGCFSFNEIKNLTTGEGGMLTTNDPALCERMRLLRLHGAKNGLAMDLGTKCTMTEMEAALGRAQLAKLPAMNTGRQEACAILAKGLVELPGISVQQAPAGGKHVYSRFVLRISPTLAGIDRETLSAELKERGFALDPVYPVPLYRHPLFLSLIAGEPPPGLAFTYAQIYKGTDAISQYANLALPNVEKFCGEQIGFIVPADVKQEDTAQLLSAIQEITQGKSHVS